MLYVVWNYIEKVIELQIFIEVGQKEEINKDKHEI